MNKEEIIQALSRFQAGSFTSALLLRADMASNMRAAAKRDGKTLFRVSRQQAQAKVPYASIEAVREALAKGERDAPGLPAAAAAFHSVEKGCVFYSPKRDGKPLLFGFRPIGPSRLVRWEDSEGREVTETDARAILRPSYFTKRPPAPGQGDWRTVYCDTVQDIG